MQLVVNFLQRGLHLSSWREPRGLAGLVAAVVLPVLGSACTPALPVPMSGRTDPLFVSVRVFLRPARKIPCSGGCSCPQTWSPLQQTPRRPWAMPQPGPSLPFFAEALCAPRCHWLSPGRKLGAQSQA